MSIRADSLARAESRRMERRRAAIGELQLLAGQIHEPWWLNLTKTVLFHDPRGDYEFKGDARLLERVAAHKRLTSQPATHGLPIGNLSSQFFLNVLLDRLDQHVKHYIRAQHYVRYVDDFVILGQSTGWLEAVHFDIAMFLPAELGMQLNESKTLIQPINRGMDFVGQIIKPHRRVTRRRVLNHALRQIEIAEAGALMEKANSYFGILGQATKSFGARVALARAVLRRGRAVNGLLTKSFRSAA